MSENIASLINRDAHRLETVSASPLLDCQIIAGHVLGKDRTWLYAHDDAELSDTEFSTYRSLIERRLKGEPVAYITGHREFWNRSFEVSSATLVPRPETELLVATLLDAFDNSPRVVVDLGTGSGIIAVCLAAERAAWQVTGVDLSREALYVAAVNGRGLPNLTWSQGRWCDELKENSIDILVSNPPYIREADPHLEFLSHEPRTALVSGSDGLEAIREIVSSGYDCLKPGGSLMLEHGYDQQQDVKDLMRRRGFTQIESYRDLDDTPRAVMGRRL
jgi:release factor glutamine methyltransferase